MMSTSPDAVSTIVCYHSDDVSTSPGAVSTLYHIIFDIYIYIPLYYMYIFRFPIQQFFEYCIVKGNPSLPAPMTDSTQNATPPKSTKSKNWNSSVQIHIQSKSQFDFVPRDTEKSEFLDLVDSGDLAMCVSGNRQQAARLLLPPLQRHSQTF